MNKKYSKNKQYKNSLTFKAKRPSVFPEQKPLNFCWLFGRHNLVCLISKKPTLAILMYAKIKRKKIVTLWYVALFYTQQWHTYKTT